MTETADKPGLLNRRSLLTGATMLSIPLLGVVGFAAHTGRIDLLTPVLPEGEAKLPAVPGVNWNGAPVPPISRSVFAQATTILHVWASWCPTCRKEHEHYMKLSERTDVQVFGLGNDDSETKMAEYLSKTGNPYKALSVDHHRLYVRALKQRGVPSTYVFDKAGTVVWRIHDALDTTIINTALKGAINKAQMLA